MSEATRKRIEFVSRRTDQNSEAGNIDQLVEKCDGDPELRQTAEDHRVRDQLHVHASSTMGAEKARKSVTAMSDLRAIENVGTPFEQTLPSSAYQPVFACNECAKRAHDAECNQHR